MGWGQMLTWEHAQWFDDCLKEQGEIAITHPKKLISTQSYITDIVVSRITETSSEGVALVLCLLSGSSIYWSITSDIFLNSKMQNNPDSVFVGLFIAIPSCLLRHILSSPTSWWCLPLPWSWTLRSIGILFYMSSHPIRSPTALCGTPTVLMPVSSLSG